MDTNFSKNSNAENTTIQRGASLVECALLIALIAGVTISAVKSVGAEIKMQYNEVSDLGFGVGAGASPPPPSGGPLF